MVNFYRKKKHGPYGFSGYFGYCKFPEFKGISKSEQASSTVLLSPETHMCSKICFCFHIGLLNVPKVFEHHDALVKVFCLFSVLGEGSLFKRFQREDAVSPLLNRTYQHQFSAKPNPKTVVYPVRYNDSLWSYGPKVKDQRNPYGNLHSEKYRKTTRFY